jgi:hypothetical protein
MEGRPAPNAGNLSTDKRFEILKRFRTTGSNPPNSGVDNVQHRRGVRTRGNQELIQFLYVAKASCGEARSQLYVALDQSKFWKETKKYSDPQTGFEF